MTHLTGFRGNWISFSEHSIIIGKAGLNLFCNEACPRVAATLAFRKVAGQKETDELMDGYMGRQSGRSDRLPASQGPLPDLRLGSHDAPRFVYPEDRDSSSLRNVGKYSCTHPNPETEQT